MPHLPTFQYAIGGKQQPISPNSAIWGTPLPSNRHHFSKYSAKTSPKTSLTHGDYFKAARSFLEQNQFEVLTTALSRCRSQSILPVDIQSVRITLMKHGEFYHPAQLTVALKEASISLVLNAAISPLGQKTMHQETAFLARFSQDDTPPELPRIFGKGKVTISEEQSMAVFLGDWFDGYHEFHLSNNFGDTQNVCVWDEEKSPFFLNEVQTYALYHDASKLLTRHYNLSTGDQIYPWHHAAGDFIVKVTEHELSVRLITVRHYGPIFVADKTNLRLSNEDQMMAGLLVFLLNLSIRMRLDRWDGIGDIAWADDAAMIGIWDGFRSGIQSNKFLPATIEDPLENFRLYLRQFNEQALNELSSSLINTYHPEAPEIPVILKHLKSHIATLCDTISTIGFPL